MTAANSSLHFFPRQARRRVALQIRLPSGEFLKLPFVNVYFFGLGCEVVPEIFDELEFLRRAELENGWHGHKELRNCCKVARMVYSQRGCKQTLL